MDRWMEGRQMTHTMTNSIMFFLKCYVFKTHDLSITLSFYNENYHDSSKLYKNFEKD
jgi:hypothetical protein